MQFCVCTSTCRCTETPTRMHVQVTDSRISPSLLNNIEYWTQLHKNLLRITHSATIILINTGIRLSWSIDIAVDILCPYPLAYYRVIIWSLRTPYPVDINVFSSLCTLHRVQVSIYDTVNASHALLRTLLVQDSTGFYHSTSSSYSSLVLVWLARQWNVISGVV